MVESRVCGCTCSSVWCSSVRSRIYKGMGDLLGGTGGMWIGGGGSRVQTGSYRTEFPDRVP